jgi:uncharacterized protein (DUF1800 family)
MTIGADYSGPVTAFNRFGLGARSDALHAAAGDRRGFLLEELRTANIALIRDHAPSRGAEALTAYLLEQQQERVQQTKTTAIWAAAPAKALMATALSHAPLGLNPRPACRCRQWRLRRRAPGLWRASRRSSNWQAGLAPMRSSPTSTSLIGNVGSEEI